MAVMCCYKRKVYKYANEILKKFSAFCMLIAVHCIVHAYLVQVQFFCLILALYK